MEISFTYQSVPLFQYTILFLLINIYSLFIVAFPCFNFLYIKIISGYRNYLGIYKNFHLFYKHYFSL